MTITWGNTRFSEPELLSTWDPPLRAAVYAIMMRPDPQGNPTSYRILYFGESGNLSERGFASHHKLQCWKDHTDSEANLYVGVHPMPESTEEQRRKIESDLVSQYNPVCNST